MARTNEQVRKKDDGTPGNGGEYTESVQSPPVNSTLPESDLLHNAQGSFLYPPSVRSAEQAIEFWNHVDIDDSVLQKFQGLYGQRMDALANPQYEARVRALAEKKMAEYDAEVIAHKQTKEFQKKWAGATELGRAGSGADEAEARNHNWRVFSAEARKEAPLPSVSEVDPASIPYPELNRSEIRPLVRAAGLFAYIPSTGKITSADKEVILNHEFDLGYGKVLSVRDIEGQYKLSEIDTFLDS